MPNFYESNPYSSSRADEEHWRRIQEDHWKRIWETPFAGFSSDVWGKAPSDNKLDIDLTITLALVKGKNTLLLCVRGEDQVRKTFEAYCKGQERVVAGMKAKLHPSPGIVSIRPPMSSNICDLKVQEYPYSPPQEDLPEDVSLTKDGLVCRRSRSILKFSATPADLVYATSLQAAIRESDKNLKSRLASVRYV